MPKKLPKTASPVPLVGLIGLLSLGTAGLLWRFSAKHA
jgi:LPXTG-motif cell wall-anchored protein